MFVASSPFCKIVWRSPKSMFRPRCSENRPAPQKIWEKVYTLKAVFEQKECSLRISTEYELEKHLCHTMVINLALKWFRYEAYIYIICYRTVSCFCRYWWWYFKWVFGVLNQRWAWIESWHSKICIFYLQILCDIRVIINLLNKKIFKI